mmetsp:Transcript_12852/g.19262  ORF Transcript_12852/g.19262 Transcript_12852/m.19262 type:complete len:322 (-) Transcript_12852:135-1100(-)
MNLSHPNLFSRLFLCLFSLLPPIDIITDVLTIIIYALRGYSLSFLLAVFILYMSLRFSLIYAALHPNPYPWYRLFVLYIPGMLLLFSDVIPQLRRIQAPQVAPSSSEVLQVQQEKAIVDTSKFAITLYGRFAFVKNKTADAIHKIVIPFRHFDANNIFSFIFYIPRWLIYTCAFECTVILPAVILEPILITRGALTCAGDCLFPATEEADKLQQDEHILYGRVLLQFTEGAFEALPQFILQVYTYQWAVRNGQAEAYCKFSLCSFHLAFFASATTSLLGIIISTWTFYCNFDRIAMMIENSATLGVKTTNNTEKLRIHSSH